MTTERLPGPDAVRAVAIFGVMLMNYHGYLIIRGAERADGGIAHIIDPWEGPLSTRFAALFVLTAGVGVTLLTRRAAEHSASPSERAAVSWRLARRGLLLYGGGLVFDFVWPGTILPFYGAMFVLAAVLWRLPSWTLLAVGAVSAASGAAIEWWAFETVADGGSVAWLHEPGPRSPRGLMLDLFVNGTHPLLPWLAFFCLGIVIGRHLHQPRRLAMIGAAGVGGWVVARIIASDEAGTLDALLRSPHPFDRGLVYSLSAIGSSVAVFAAINALATRWHAHPVTAALQQAGQLSLTIYVSHALIFLLIVDRLDLVEPGGPSTAIGLAVAIWLVSTAAAIAWQRRYGRGPVEWLYRRLSA